MDPASRVAFGKTGLTVTRLGLGTAPLGNILRAVEEDEARATIERAWALGVRFFDTAPLYGHGIAERRLGAVLAHYPRDEFVLATKVGRLLRADAPVDPGQKYVGTPPVQPVFDFSYDGVLRSVEESLTRLGLDRVDILHIHDPDDAYEAALVGAYRALDRLRREGTIRAVGAGMNQSAMLARFAQAADFDCFLLAGRYTLLEQGALSDLLPICVERQIAIIIGGVYNTGLLVDPGPGATYNYLPAPAELIERAQALRAVCAGHGVPLAAAAIQFPAAHPAVGPILTGARSVAEIEENVAMLRHPIPAVLWPDLKQAGLLAVDAPTPAASA